MSRIENREYKKDFDNEKNIDIENIAAYELDKYMKQWGYKSVLVDVRDKIKYDTRHIEGAINISYKDMQNGKFNLPKEKIIVLYCDRGGLSMTAARYLSGLGYDVRNVVGGIRNYRPRKK